MVYKHFSPVGFFFCTWYIHIIYKQLSLMLGHTFSISDKFSIIILIISHLLPSSLRCWDTEQCYGEDCCPGAAGEMGVLLGRRRSIHRHHSGARKTWQCAGWVQGQIPVIYGHRHEECQVRIPLISLFHFICRKKLSRWTLMKWKVH